MLLERDQEFILAPLRAAYRPAAALKAMSTRWISIVTITVG